MLLNDARAASHISVFGGNPDVQGEAAHVRFVPIVLQNSLNRDFPDDSSQPSKTAAHSTYKTFANDSVTGRITAVNGEVYVSTRKLAAILATDRNSTYQYKGRAVDVREVGRDLGARYIVEGSIRKSGDKIRVAQWLEACT